MNSSFKKEFSNFTGAGVRIGIIDSGYVKGKRDINIAKGINLLSNSNNNDYTDKIGHGTACAGIISKKAPDVLIYPVKIFENELESDINKLSAAINWCIENKLHLINLSSGTTEESNKKQLKQICRNQIFSY